MEKAQAKTTARMQHPSPNEGLYDLGYMAKQMSVSRLFYNTMGRDIPRNRCLGVTAVFWAFLVFHTLTGCSIRRPGAMIARLIVINIKRTAM